MLEKIDSYPLLLRRWQAVELCRVLGGSERTLRRMIKKQTIVRHRFPGGVQFRYRRDDIIKEFEGASAPVSASAPATTLPS